MDNGSPIYLGVSVLAKGVGVLDQLTNARTDDSTSHVSLGNQETTPRKHKQISSGELYAMVQAALETSLIIVGLLLVTLQLPHRLGDDGMRRYEDLVSLFSTHSLFQPHSRYSLIELDLSFLLPCF